MSNTLRLFCPLVLQLDCLSIDEDTLALVWLWFPPHAYLCGKLHDHLFLRTLQKKTRWLWGARLHALRNA